MRSNQLSYRAISFASMFPLGNPCKPDCYQLNSIAAKSECKGTILFLFHKILSVFLLEKLNIILKAPKSFAILLTYSYLCKLMRQQGKYRIRQTALRVSGDGVLIEFLLNKMGGMSRSSIKQLLGHRCVTVNGHVETRHDYPLHDGDQIVITNSAGKPELNHPKLKVVYEDDEIIVVEKKCGLLTVATNLNSRETTVFSILKQYVRMADPRGGVYVVHRLDRETSGLLVFARNPQVQSYMRDNWRQIVTMRTYVAVVEGDATQAMDAAGKSLVDGNQYTIKSWLTENDRTKRVYSSPTDNGGQYAVTHYRVVKTAETAKGRLSLLELHLDTGRTNQIRVQMQSVNCPVVGDRKYGSGATPLIDRLALHARILEFRHPKTGSIVHFETPVPREFLALFH